jgi:phosphoribosylaminoimidazole-succinocarboxamide synthase
LSLHDPTPLHDTIQPDRQTDGQDIYDLGDQLLVVETDRITVCGQALPGLIPMKGRAIAQLSVYWHELFASVLGSNFISADTADLPQTFQPFSDQLAGRFLLMRKVELYPLECRVFGYLTDEVLPEYLKHRTVGGVEVQPGLSLNSLLDQFIYIPFFVEKTGQLTQIDLMKTVELYGNRDAMVICSNTLDVYEITHDLARSRGFIIADTALKIGQADGQYILTEVPTPDNSLFWLEAEYQDGHQQVDYIRQPLADWLAANWDFIGPAPDLPEELVALTSQRLIEVCELVTGEDFED